MLELVQIPLACSLARRLQLRQREREGLLQRALDASEVERRQIASDLHDGVVQDLAGVAYALSASARARRRGRPTASSSSSRADDRARERPGPPLADRRPLPAEPAGGGPRRPRSRDLTERARDRGVPTTLDRARARSTGCPTAPPACSTGARRRGCATSSTTPAATAAQVRLGVEDRTALLEVVDDGRGFDDARRWPPAPSEGHVGLKALRGLLDRRRRLARRAVAPG